MVAYWAVDRQGLEESATHENSANGVPARDGGEAMSHAGTASNGDAAEDTDGLARTEARDEGGGISEQERVFLGIVSRYAMG